MRARLGTLCTLLLCALSGSGFDGCPLAGEPAATPPATTGPTLDVGGAAGARWRVRFAGPLSVTLRAGQRVASGVVSGGRPLVLLGQTIDVASFCLRPDVACPQHVLPALAAIAQPQPDPRDVLLEFNRRGPLARVRAAGIPGRIEGSELAFSLATTAVAGDPCNLRQPSAVTATAALQDEAPPATDAAVGAADGSPLAAVASSVATQLAGRVTVAYGGSCLMIGGSAAVEPEAVVELAASFSALRD